MFSYQESKDSELIAQMNYLSEINWNGKQEAISYVS